LTRDWLLEVTAHREADAFDRAIDLRITRLRRKVEIDPAHPDAIRTASSRQKTDLQPRRAPLNTPVLRNLSG
jgi:hypothetical protein